MRGNLLPDHLLHLPDIGGHICLDGRSDLCAAGKLKLRPVGRAVDIERGSDMLLVPRKIRAVCALRAVCLLVVRRVGRISRIIVNLVGVCRQRRLAVHEVRRRRGASGKKRGDKSRDGCQRDHLFSVFFLHVQKKEPRQTPELFSSFL